MNSRNYAYLSLALVTVSGCSTLPALKNGTSDEAISSALSSSVTQVPEKWSSKHTNSENVQIGWIDALEDKTLSKLVREAQQNNQDLQKAAANVERSWALARQAGVPLLPSVGLSGGADRTFFSNNSQQDIASFDWGIQATWEADIWGRIKAGQKAAASNALTSEADFLFAQYSIAAAVADAYFIGLEAKLQAEVARNNLTTLSETDRIVNIQYNEGLAMAQDVALSASDVAATKASLLLAEGARRDAVRALQVLIGRYPDADLELEEALPEVPQLPPVGLPSELLERRPDIIAAGQALKAATYSLDLAKVARLPSFNLTASSGSTSNELRNLFDVDQIISGIAGDIAYLLFDNGFNKAQIDQAKSEYEIALIDYAQTALSAFEEVETNLDQFEVVRKRTEALSQSANQANRALEVARKRYREGETDLIDVLTIQQRVFSAESNKVSAEKQRIDEWIDLNLALGGSWKQSPQ